MPAAVSAARAGARVILIEEDPAIGGAPVDMFVTFLCGGPRVGIFNELIQSLNATEDIDGAAHKNFTGSGQHWYLPSSFARVLATLVRRELNITLVTGARVSGAIVKSDGQRDRLLGVEVDTGNGAAPAAFMAPVTIDATGTGSLSELAGAKVMFGREAKTDFGERFGRAIADSKVMPCTLMLTLQRLRPGAKPLDETNLQYAGKLEANVGWIKMEKNRPLFLQRNTGTYLQWGASVLCDTRDPMELGRAYRVAMGMIEDDVAKLLEQGFGVNFAPKIGVRECRRVTGEHILTLQDLKSGKMPDDVLATGVYPLDLWDINEKLTEADKQLPPYGLPYRSGIAKGFEGLLLAGKHISGTHLAMGAYRVQPIVAAFGQGIGAAAAMAAKLKTGVRDVDLKTLQSKLRSAGSLTV
ncbi:MAG: FAD-dependent oxidoreductase [Opitutaceae bacterium]|nr:FAD-dependent oxidoreductase [Opitutaceae bacterium]